MTTALYRRYRPDTFQDVIGQEHVTAPLMAALCGDRVTHAYLFSGPRGCGKTTSARILARCLNCEQFPTDTPCGVCPSCRDLATGGPGSLDVVEIDAASHNGVDDARDLRERAVFAPARDRFKIFILDEAHMVTPQGFNALLKLVEEPPAHVKFIFATTEPEKVIGTIRSRTHHYPFRLVPPETLETYLGQLCHSEGVAVGPGVFPLVTRAGGGSVRDTLSVMDQLIGGAVDGEVDYQRAVALLGYTDTTMLDQCVDSIAAASGAGVFRVVDRVIASGHDPRRFVEDLLQRLRDLLVIALAGAEAGPALGSLPADELERMEVQARTIGSATLSRYADLTAQALSNMVGATSPRLQLELLMARLLVPQHSQVGPVPQRTAGAPAVSQPGTARQPAGMAQQQAAPAGQDPRALAAAIARRASGGDEDVATDSTGLGHPVAATPSASSSGPAAPEAPLSRPADTSSAPVAPSAAAPQPTADAEKDIQPGTAQQASGTAGADGEMIRTRWGEVLEAIKRERRATWALVEPHAQPGDIEAGVFHVLFRSPGLVNAFSHGHAPVVAQALHQALGLQVQVEAVLLGGPGGPSGSGGTGPAGGPGAPAADGGREGVGASGWGEPTHVGPAGPASRAVAPDSAAAGPTASAPSSTTGPIPEFVPPDLEEVAPSSTAGPIPLPAPTPTAAPDASRTSPGRAPAPEAAPEPVGWGEVAPIGQARRPHPSPIPDEPAQDTGASAEVSPVAVPSRPPSRVEAPAEVDDPPLATVHRLHALPEIPGRASSSAPQHQSAPAPVTPSSPSATGTVLADRSHSPAAAGPDEPSAYNPAGTGPAHGGSDTTASRVPGPATPGPEHPGSATPGPEHPGASPAAMAAARAAARGEAPPPGAVQVRPVVRLEDDVISDDDEDAEEAGVVGLEVVKRLLGATVLEEVVITDHGPVGS
ncbi:MULTISPECIES: DNA polymerase III subunit gamma and tau [Actinomyces]|uniref:DNA-directed DNA polymerase n=1 Tax=Actinomyces respiraculi TaxID=2744574 RepID=A0A7T0LKC4_9ACTO|nr:MULTISPECIES: DNA polymerase III subunit gamma and tau [Actinomyces]QPL05359.1 DNA polymerase III subunit gamma and tau [Actinomyces respiraculi]